MLFETNKDKGRAGMAMGIAYFGANGYTVNIPLNDTQWYDFVIEKDGIFQTRQVADSETVCHLLCFFCLPHSKTGQDGSAGYFGSPAKVGGMI